MAIMQHITIGVTGHQRLSDPDAWTWVESEMKREIEKRNGSSASLRGVSSLAIGADQLFARCINEAGGSLTAVIPFSDYARTFETKDEKANFESLKNQSTEVIVMPKCDDDQTAYLLAGQLVVEKCDVLFAIWDGQPAKGKGGTGDAVKFAVECNKPVVHFNPDVRTVREIKG